MSQSIVRSGGALWLAVMVAGGPGAVVLAAPPASMSQNPDRVDTPTVEEARALQQAGRWQEAAEAWRQITEQDSENPTAWFLLGYCLHAAGRLDEAIDVHQKAATFDEYHGIALYNLGCAYALSGRSDEALDALGRSQAAGFSVRDHAGDDPDLESIRGDSRFATLLEQEPVGVRGGLQQAMGRLHLFLEAQAPRIKQRLGGVLQQVARRARGMLGMLQQKLADDERFAGVAKRLQGWLGRKVDAGARPDQAGGADSAETRPAVASLDQARRHQQAGEWSAAAAAYEAVIQAQPDSVPAWFGLGYCLHMSGDYEKAIKAHQKAATFEPIKGVALYNLACAYALTGRTEAAVTALEASREAGFDIAEPMQSDSDLDSLRDDARFKKLLVDVARERGI